MSNSLAAMRPELVRNRLDKNLLLTPVMQMLNTVLFDIRFYHKNIFLIFNQTVIPHFSKFL